MNEKKSDMIDDILKGISKQLPTDLTAEQMEKIDKNVREKWGGLKLIIKRTRRLVLHFTAMTLQS